MKHGITASIAIFLLLVPPAFAQETGDSEVDAYLADNQRSLTLVADGDFQTSASFSIGMSGNYFGIGSFGTTQATSAFRLAYGLSRRTEFFAELPYSWSRHTQSFLDDTSRSTLQSGTMIVGFRSVLAFERDNRPEIVGTVAFSHPIGRSVSEPGMRFSIDAYRMLDPVLLNFGLGVGVGLETGATQFDLHGGVDFAISDRFSLGFDVNWATDGQSFADPIRDGLSFTVSASITSESGVSTFSPFVSLGASEGATDAVVGVNWARRW